MYLRKIRPRTTCLYSAASMCPRSLSAVCQSCCSKPRLAPLLDFFWSLPTFFAIARLSPKWFEEKYIRRLLKKETENRNGGGRGAWCKRRHSTPEREKVSWHGIEGLYDSRVAQLKRTVGSKRVRARKSRVGNKIRLSIFQVVL